MSRKNSREAKQQRRILKMLRATPPAYIDLIDYVKVRTNCTTTMAKKVLLAGALRVDSHPVGFKWANDPTTGQAKKVLDPLLPAKHRKSIVIQWNEVEAAR